MSDFFSNVLILSTLYGLGLVAIVGIVIAILYLNSEVERGRQLRKEKLKYLDLLIAVRESLDKKPVKLTLDTGEEVEVPAEGITTRFNYLLTADGKEIIFDTIEKYHAFLDKLTAIRSTRDMVERVARHSIVQCRSLEEVSELGPKLVEDLLTVE